MNERPINWSGTELTAFGLQSPPSASGTFNNIPGATSPYTNSISGAQQFFRLVK